MQKRIQTQKSTTVISLTGLVSLGVLGLILLSAVIVMLPSNVVNSRAASPMRITVGFFLPQGWAFFTKAPDDPEISVYAPIEGSFESISKFPNARAENLWGVSRKQRSQGPEMATLANNVQEWLTCNELETGEDCLTVALETLIPKRIENTSTSPTICGLVLVSETVPVPWSFRDHYNGWRLDQRVAPVEAAC